MSWIDKGATDPRVLLISDKAGFKDFNDLRKSKREIKLSTAAGVGTGAYSETLIVAPAFDLPFKALLSYSGRERAMGMMRGEVDGVIGGESSVAELGGAAGGTFFLASSNVANTPNARDFVTNYTQRKVVDLIEGQGLIYRLCTGPPNIPPDRLAALRQAFMSAYNSKELKAETGKRPVDPLDGETVARMIAAVIDQPPDIVALLKGLTWTE